MRVINFNPGPAAIPLPALERARDELLDFAGTGMSIMEHSHRGKDYEAVHNEAIALLREMMNIPDNYYVMFMQGGGHLQFCTVPLNFMHPGKSADYLITGHWSKAALDEARTVGQPRVACSTEENGIFTRIPRQNELNLDPNAAYAHFTSNNTLFGTQWRTFPDSGKVPLVVDMSSDFFSERIDVSKFGLIYAGAQKNVGPSGVVIVVVSKDLVDHHERADIPHTLKYSTHAKSNSLSYTAPTFSIYMLRNVLAWAKGVGGLKQIEQWNQEKARLLYTTIDRLNGFYKSPVEKESRSLMNVVFRLPTPALDEKFVSDARAAGMVGLKGHRITGGIRVSIYNAVTVQSVKNLCDFMEKFAHDHG